MKDIFRRYPNMYEVTIATLCENLESLDEPEAKASMIWIIGEYAGRIDNAGEILGLFLDSWMDEGPQVQLQLLTAVVKLYLENLKQVRVVYLSTSIYIYLSIGIYLSIYLSVSIYPSIYLSIYLSIYRYLSPSHSSSSWCHCRARKIVPSSRKS